MACKYCGGYTEKGMSACHVCARRYAVPKRKAPAGKRKKTLSSVLRSYMHLIILLATVFVLVFSILNLFSVLNVWVNATKDGESVVGPMARTDLLTVLTERGETFTPGYMGNIIFGLFLLTAAFVGALYSLKRMMGIPLYGRFVGRYLGAFGGPALIMGALGMLGGILQIVMYAFCRWSYEEKGLVVVHKIEIRVGVNWTTWMLLVLSAALIALDILVRKKKK